MPQYWREVHTRDFAVPEDRSLGDLTAELVTMLGADDPELRDGIAYPTLATWIERGVYDDLLSGLGDGMAAGLQAGLGDVDSDQVFRRSFSALVLAEVVARDNAATLVGPDTVLGWGDRIASWLVRERDLRGYLPGKGWAHAIAHGADALAALAKSRHFNLFELTVLLDVIADRITTDSQVQLIDGEPDRLAQVVLAIFARNQVPLKMVEPWLARIAAAARATGSGADESPYLRTSNAQNLLRSIYLHLSVAPPTTHQIHDRADLLLALASALRDANPFTMATSAPPSLP